MNWNSFYSSLRSLFEKPRSEELEELRQLQLRGTKRKKAKKFPVKHHENPKNYFRRRK